MMKWLISFVAGLTTLGTVFASGYYLGKKFQGYRINRVVDGDTLGVTDLRTGRDWRLRLWGIDAPEVKECGAKEAKAEMEKMVGGLKPRIVILGVDGFGRYIARLWVLDQEVAKTIVADGWAKVDISTESVYEDLRPSLADVGELRRLEDMAKSEKLGIWGDLCKKKW